MEWVLVTGGAGFIGSHVCESLLSCGYNVGIVDNFNDYYSPALKRENITDIKAAAATHSIELVLYEADIRNTKSIDYVFKDRPYEAVIHLAACAGVRPSIENAPLYIDVNINGTVNILEHMRKYQIRKLLFASSSSVYGNSDKTPFDEDDPVDRPISPYAATKKAGELICHTYHHLYDINVACLRFFTVYGPRQRPDLAIRKFAELLYAARPIPFYGDGSARRDYTYVTDTLDGILKALAWVDSAESRFDIFNLGESQTVSLSEMVFALESATGKKALLQKFPIQPGDVTATYADIGKAKCILGYEPKVSFEKGVQLFIEWFRTRAYKNNVV